MAKPYDTKLIMLVSQQPFETQDMNQFCKLVPAVFVDGQRADAGKFPNDGEIWWMLTARTSSLAAPGKLLVGIVENAVRYDEDDPMSSFYQVVKDSVRDLDQNDGFEVLMIPNNAVDDLQDIVSNNFALDLPFSTTSQVMLRWRGNVCGPFRTTKSGSKFTFTPTHIDMHIYLVAEKTFDDATKSHRVVIQEQVSRTTDRRSESYSLVPCRHEVLLPAGFERIFQVQHEKKVLEPIEQKLQRFAKKCLTRSKSQQFRAMLQELEDIGRESAVPADLVDTIKRMRTFSESQDTALNNTARALLESGMIGEDRIRKAEQTFAEKYVQDRTAQLQAKAQEATIAAEEELRKVQKDLKDVQSRLLKEETERRARLERSLETDRENARKAIQLEREILEQEKKELEHQRIVLQKNLEEVTRELRDAGDNVLNRFLTIAPLLGTMGVSTAHRTPPIDMLSGSTHAAEQVPPFQVPGYVHAAITSESAPLSEEEFFNRFKKLVEENGFVYRLIDLQRFHLSVKCSEMTVLGGPSGTGKSSLPAMYSRALQGHEASDDRPGCLMVNVNPSWMDIHDLLGHLNTIEGKFYPTESGLFQYLVTAQEEFQARGRSTGLYLTCLDEMNLSQVEHYFSDVMMVLERDDSARYLQCFSPEVVKAVCPFRQYSRLRISPGVRFIGTVNFDETTRLLSDRFLDRANLIRLGASPLPGEIPSKSEGLPRASGPMVTLGDFESWRSDAALPTDLGLVMDEMRPLLVRLGCPLSPRVYRGMCRFVASSTKLLPAAAAFDVQVAQRIVPKVRSLVTRQQIDALDQLLRFMNSAKSCTFEESLPLLETVRDSLGSRVWDLEE